MVTLIRTAGPEDELFTTQQLRDQLRVSVPTDADEANLKAYLAAAVEWVEGVCGCSVMPQTWRLGLDQFPSWSERWARSSSLQRPILLPRGPLVSVESVAYTDDGGADHVLTDTSGYVVSRYEKPPAVYPPFAGSFPVARLAADSVRVTYTAGMGADGSGNPAPEAVKESVKMAVKFLVGHWYNNREPVPVDVKPEKIPYGLETMIWASRIYRFDWESYYSC